MSSPSQVAEHCLKSAKDLSGLLLLYSARGSAGGLATLTSAALEGGKNNVAFGAEPGSPVGSRSGSSP